MMSVDWRRLRANLGPAHLVGGIRVEHIAGDWRSITVALQPRGLRFSRREAHSGAALYAMTDPFPTLMVRHLMGPGFLVWDRAGSVELLAAARGRVWARIELDEDDVQRLHRMTADGARHLHVLSIDIRDAEGMAVARVEKMIYVRRTATAASERA